MMISNTFLFHMLLIGSGTIAGLLKFKKLSKPFKLLTALLIIIFGSELASRFLLFSVNNHFTTPTYHFLIPLLILVNTMIYLNLLDKAGWMKRLVAIISVLILGLSVYNSLYFQGLYEFPSNGILMMSILMVLMTMLQYNRMLQFPVREKLLHQPVFWLNTGNLLFQSTTFFIWGIYNHLVKNNSLPEYIHVTVFISNLILYTSYLVALILEIKKNNGKLVRKNEWIHG